MGRTERTTKDAVREEETVTLSYQPSHGSVYTRPWVTNFVLDLAGYTADRNLVDAVAIEPACGDGEFLEAMVRRLSDSCRRQGRPLKDCSQSLVASDIDPDVVDASRRRVEDVLLQAGWEAEESREAVRGWIRAADFLLDPTVELMQLAGGADFVLGNPPYVRLESIDPQVAVTYRSLYKSMIGRADLYVGFYERALNILTPRGVCGFICADRWMLNQYGSALRKLITTGAFAVEAVVEMHTADAFHDEVLAYPAITVIRKGTQGRALVAKVERGAGPSVETLVETAHQLRRPGGEGPPVIQGENCVVVEE